MKTACDWLFCCDGDDLSGLGHLGRCLGYAEMLADAGFDCAFRGSYGSTAACMIEAGGFTFQSAARWGSQKSLADLMPQPGKGVLLDSYGIDSDFISSLQQSLQPRPLILLDDFAAHPRYDCAALVNFTMGAASLTYPPGPARRYLGPDFFPARRWLRRVRSRRLERTGGEVQQLFISAGGRDLCGINPTFLTLLASKHHDKEIAILVGDDDESRAVLTLMLPLFPNARLLPRQPDLEHWLDWADACFCGGGLVKYECLYAGVPVISIAQNGGQQADSALLAQHGLIADLGSGQPFQWAAATAVLDRFMDDPGWRQSMQRSGLATVGGSTGDGGLLPFSEAANVS